MPLLRQGRRDTKGGIARAFTTAAPFVAAGRFDAILCHFGQIGEQAVLLREAGVLKGPIATVFHGADISRRVHSMGPEIYQELFARGDLFLPVSVAWRNRLIELGCPADRIQVHRMGVDLGKWRCQARRLRDGRPVALISVCRLVEKKGIEYAIRALSSILQADPTLRVTYTIVGDGPLTAHLREVVSALGLQEVIRFAGPQSPDVVVEMMSEAHLFLAPSVTAHDGDQEGVPVSIMEAMAQGMPVLATTHSGIPELVEHGIHGYLVPERDCRQLAAYLERLIRTPASWPQLGANGRRRIAEQHDQEKLLTELERQLILLAGNHAC